jgi:adenylate cyclase
MESRMEGHPSGTGIATAKPRAPLLRLVSRLAELGAAPDDSEEVRLRKGGLILLSSATVLLALVWVITYWVLGHPLAAAIPLCYQVISVLTLVGLARTRRFRLYRDTQFVMMLLLPVGLQLTLGGFVSSSAVALWSFTTPVGALIFSGARRAVPWFAAFAVLMVAAGAVDPLVHARPLPTGVVLTMSVLNILGPAGVCFIALLYFTSQRDRAMLALDLEHRKLVDEQVKSERLLLNILPRAVAEQLKESSGVIAERFEDASVLFADIVGFTPLSEGMPPEDVVLLLDRLFSEFDALAERLGLEKIKTIGDAYMVAGGLPERREGHAEAMGEMALTMQALTRDLTPPSAGAVPLDLRIGIDIGPVVAGVVGRRKFIYDLWGDTVNTASRMESQGLPGEIQVTARAMERLRDRFALMPRGRVEVKGKGPMETYLLRARKPANAPEEPAGARSD